MGNTTHFHHENLSRELVLRLPTRRDQCLESNSSSHLHAQAPERDAHLGQEKPELPFGILDWRSKGVSDQHCGFGGPSPELHVQFLAPVLVSGGES